MNTLSTTQKEQPAETRAPKSILTLTRACSEACSFCAVDAYRISGNGGWPAQQHRAKGELLPEEWRAVAEKILTAHPHAAFDLSGGDCLALPWVGDSFIPFLMERVRDRNHVALTAPAASLGSWLERAKGHLPESLPGSVHITYDGYRAYSFANIKLAPVARAAGVDMHVECPLTSDNCNTKDVKDIYLTARESGIGEMLIMRFFPVGRAAKAISRCAELEPLPDMYRAAIAEFRRLESTYKDGPKIKVQCALKKFDPCFDGSDPCKMGDQTWCVMPDGTMLICPWAYGMGGNPLHDCFVAGNILTNSLGMLDAKAVALRAMHADNDPGECRILSFLAAGDAASHLAALFPPSEASGPEPCRSVQ